MTNATIFITQNAPFLLSKRINQTNGTPLNLTGYTALMVLQQYLGDDTKYSIDGVIAVPANGIIEFSIASTSTATLPAGGMFYSIYLMPPATDKMMLENGIVKVIGAP